MSTHAVGTRTSDHEEINMLNMKPYRTAEQKAEAKATAHKGKDGAWRSKAPVSYHTKAKSNF